ncbi:MAG: transpeptidase family protein [Prevotellaceae bacterium]|jgi:cell division protein FtsI (penicillin-binding protein 3)|nr:transpeptidase family protein [Prevotellaceae bacterium]
MQLSKNILLQRATAIYMVMALIGLVIVCRAMFLQFDSELKGKAARISSHSEEIGAKRGDILAHDGRLLVTSLPQYQLYMDCKVPEEAVFNAGVKGLSVALSEFFKDKTAAAYEKILRDGRANKRRYVRLGNRMIKHAESEKVYRFPILKQGWREGKTYDQNKGGGIFEARSMRTPSYGNLAARTLGLVNENGVSVGIEGAFDYALKGTPGKRLLRRIANGDWVPVNSMDDVDPRNGYDVVTTLDVDIQDAAETALRDQLRKAPDFEAGTVIIMEVKTGEIRAIANMKRMADGSYTEAFNYAIAQATEPGSTFKLATLIALLEDGLVDMHQKVNTEKGQWNYKGHLIKDVSNEGYGVIPLQEVFEKSSNVGFAKLAVNHYLGKERQYVDKLYAMKLNTRLGLQISGEAPPQIRYVNDKLWSGLSLPMMSMGYEVLLTPVMTLTFYNAVANGGRMVKPKFVSELRQGGELRQRFSTEVITTSICSHATLEKVHRALCGVVEKGTAKNIRDDRYKIAGKTGTSRIAFDNGYELNGFKKHQPSFAGFFPAENPVYSGIVVLYTGPTKNNFYGGSWAAPVFKQIADKIYVSHPEWEEALQAKPSDTMLADLIEDNMRTHTPKKPVDKKLPSVVGKTLKEALFLLENRGLNVDFFGSGRVVKQSLPAGTPVGREQTITLELK